MLSLFGSITLLAHEEGSNPAQVYKGQNDIVFIRNMGQWKEPFNFKSSIPGGKMYLTDEGLVYDFISPKDFKKANDDYHKGINVDDYKLNMHAYKVKFLNKSANSTIVPSKKTETKYNYFIGSDQSNWRSDVGGFKQVTEKNIYPGIDLVVKTEKNSIKYDFIVAPGVSTQQIQLGFEGIMPSINEKGQLVFETTVNTVIENAPYVYQQIDGKEVAVAANYIMDKGVVSFEFPEGYNSAYALVIDPDLVFSTFSGSTSSQAYAYSTTYDLAGCLYIGSDAWDTGWPVTMGAYQTNFAGGGHDLAINKFNSLGIGLVYSTYLSGTGWEIATSLWAETGELYLFGSTNSSDFPITNGAFSAAKSGTWDAFVARLSVDGTQLLGSTYIGGSGSEGFQAVWSGGTNFNLYDVSFNMSSQLSPGDIAVDQAGAIWVTTNTNSTDFPTTSNAATLSNAGSWDAVLFSLNGDCTQLLYSSYFGGSGDDIPHSILLANNQQDIYIGGGTTSLNLPQLGMSHSNIHWGGGTDGFVARFNKASGLFTRLTYMGTTSGDLVAHLQQDAFNKIYVLGRTNGNYPVTAGAYSPNPNGFVFIDMLDTGLVTSSMSTRLGTSSTSYVPSAFLVDECGNVYVGGFGATSGMPLTSNAYQNTQKGFWFCTLLRNFSGLEYASYFGESTSDHAHIGKHRFDPEGIIYHSICCNIGGTPLTTSPQSFSQFKQTSGQDVLSFKFNFEKVGVASEFDPDRVGTPKDSFCAPHTVQFNNSSTSAMNFEWYFGDGGSSTLASPSHTYTIPGNYTVMLVAINDTMCITHDTSYLEVRVYDVDVPVLTVKDTNLCVALDSLLITVDVANPSLGVPGNVFKWTGAPGSIYGPGNTQSVWVNPSLGNVFNITVLDSVADVCFESASAVVNVNMTPRVLQILTPDTAVCKGAVVPIQALGSPGYTYRWSPTIGVSDTNSLTPNITINQSNIYMVTASYPYCIDTSDMISITMHEYPVVDIIAPTEACEGSEVTITSDVTPYRNDYIYTWEPQTILGNSNTATSVSFIADTVDRFYKLTIETPIGCSGSDSAWIVLHNTGFGDAISGVDYCPPGSAQLWAANGVSYRWNPTIGLNDPNIANPITTVGTPTTYEVYITDANNCVDTLNVIVDVHPRATLSIPDSVTVYPGGPGYQVLPNTNAMYFEWYPPSGVSNPNISDPILNPVVRTRYFVTAKTEFNCEVADSIDVLVGVSELLMPNAFNPSSEAPIFKPVLLGGWELQSFKIFNRWGTLMYESEDPNSGWDGKYKDQAQPFGVYVWVIEAKDPSGNTIQRTGNVTLIR